MYNTVISLLFLLFTVPCHASLFGLFSNPTINQDVVWLYANSSSISYVNVNIPAIMYDDNVQAAVNLTQPSRHGLRGILYSRSNACTPSDSILFFTPDYQRSLPRIALISSGGQCTFVEKIRLAQQDGAIGAIVYDLSGADSSNTSNYVDGSVYIPTDTGITIPVFHIDPRIGPLLSRHVATLAQQKTNTTQPAVRVLMLPGSSRGPNPWELTLLVMSALLAIGFMASVVVHCHLIRKNRRLREQVDQGLIPPLPDMLPMGKQLLDGEQLNKLPTRIVGGDDALPDGRAIRRRASHMSTMLSQKAAATVGATQSTRLQEQQQEDDSDGEDSCAICLESVQHGDMVRQLPCNHEFHCECIDPWLTSKAAECPLCKHDCSAPFVPRVQPDQSASLNSSKRVVRKIKVLFTRRRQNIHDEERQQPQQPDHIELTPSNTSTPST